jgi:hypothetical protein
LYRWSATRRVCMGGFIMSLLAWGADGAVGWRDPVWTSALRRSTVWHRSGMAAMGVAEARAHRRVPAAIGVVYFDAGRLLLLRTALNLCSGQGGRQSDDRAVLRRSRVSNEVTSDERQFEPWMRIHGLGPYL